VRVAKKLVDAINSLGTSVAGSNNATSIVNAVLSQDPARATDNSNRQFNPVTGENHQPLIFAPGDKVYVSITVAPPALSTTSDGSSVASLIANAASNYPGATVGAGSSNPTYNFEITLSA
jgi:hypothetical protein